jgi:hypothetical protein
MEHKLHKEPDFDFDTLRARLDAWKTAGAKTVVIEWNTGLGPTVFYYPYGERQFGMKWHETVPTTQYNELYADFIEYTLIPQIKEAVAARGMTSRAVCADQQPILVMRMRRREIEQAQRAVHAH